MVTGACWLSGSEQLSGFTNTRQPGASCATHFRNALRELLDALLLEWRSRLLAGQLDEQCVKLRPHSSLLSLSHPLGFVLP
jgi:hypothetical protein